MTTLRLIVSAALFSLLFVHTLQAQNGSSLFTLEECLEIALRDNSELKSAVYEVDRSGADVTGSYAMILPRISSTLQSGRSTIGQTVNSQNIPVIEAITIDNNGQQVTIGATRLNPATLEPVVDRVRYTSPTNSFWGHSLTLSYSQTLFDFGRSWNVIKQAKSSYNASSANLSSARQNVYATVKQRYLELLKAQELEREYTQAVERSKEQLNRTQSMYEIGSVAQIDVYRQEVTLGTDEINLINQQNVVKIAKGNLNVAIGRDPEEPIAIADIEPTAETKEMLLEEAYTTAESNNPQLRRFEYEMASAEYGRKAAKGSFWPTIGLGATYSRDNETLDRVYGNFGQNYFFTIGASMQFNIFNGFSDVADIHRQSALYSIAKENWTNQRRQLHLEVKQAYLNLNAYDQIADINQRRLRSNEEEYRLAQERYRVGAGTQLEVTEAQVSLTQARVELVRSKYDAMIAQAQLEAAMGVIEGNSQ